MKLLKGFEGFLGNFLNTTNEIYFVAWSWDLGGSPPYHYPAASSATTPCIIPMVAGANREFLGDGILLAPPRYVLGGTALRIMIWESDENQRNLGKTLGKVAQAISSSKLAHLLSLAATVTSVTGASIALLANAAAELGTLVSDILVSSGDDFVDYYEGFFSAGDPAWAAGSPAKTYTASASELQLSFV